MTEGRIVNMIKSTDKWLITGMSFVTSIAAQFLLKIPNGNQNFYTNGFLSVLVFIASIFFFNYFYHKYLNSLNHREVVVSTLLGILFSILSVIGSNLYQSDSTQIGSLRTWVIIILLVPVLSALTVVILDISSFKFISRNVIKQSSKHTFLITWLLIVLCWLPTWMVSFPGNWVYDAGFQVNYFVNTGQFDLNHPLAHSLLLVFFVLKIGKGLFGSTQVGLMLYTLFQIVLLSFSYAVLLSYLRSFRLNKWVWWGIFCLLVLSPYNSLMAVSATKNVPYTATFILIVVLLSDYSHLVGKLGIWKYWGIFIAITFINCIFLSQGIYVVLFAFLMGIVFTTGMRRQLFWCLVVIMALFQLYSGPVTSHLKGVSNPDDKKREMLSVPIMQVTSVAVDKNGNITPSQLKMVKKSIPVYKQYAIKSNEGLADQFKGTFNLESLGKFKKLWVVLGLRNITDYVDAFARLSIGYWYPGSNAPNQWATKNMEYNPIALQRTNPHVWYDVKSISIPGMKWLQNFYVQFVREPQTEKLPVISFLTNIAFNMWIVFLFVGWVIINRKRNYAVLIGLLLGLWGTLLLGPIVLYRYAFPIMSVTPLLIAIMMKKGLKNG